MLLRLLTPLFFIFLLLTSHSSLAEPRCIGVVTAGGGLDFWQRVAHGAQTAGNELGVSVIVRGPNDASNRIKQQSVISFMLKQGCEGLVIAPNTPELKPLISELLAKKIPTVYIDRDIGGERLSIIKTDSYAAGMHAGFEMAKALGGKGKVAVFREMLDKEPTTDRENGFVEAAKQSGLEVIVDQVVGTQIPDVRYKATLTLKKTPQIKGIFTPNESTTIGLIAAQRDLGLAQTIYHIGFDSNRAILKSLKSGELDGFILQKPFEMGYQGVYSIFQVLTEQEPKTEIDTGFILVTQDNTDRPEVKEALSFK